LLVWSIMSTFRCIVKSVVMYLDSQQSFLELLCFILFCFTFQAFHSLRWQKITPFQLVLRNWRLIHKGKLAVKVKFIVPV